MRQAGSLALAHDALLPRPHGGLAPGAGLALLVHLGLIAALTVSVDWRTHAPETVSAELWASVPQSAAPRPVEAAPAPAPPPEPKPVAAAPAPPAPPPVLKQPEPDIALERRKTQQAQKKALAEEQSERERVLAEKLKRAEADKIKADKAKADSAKADKAKADKDAAEAKAEEARLAKQREENLKRIMGQAGGATGVTGRTGTAAQEAAPSASYAGAVAARIRRELVFPGNVPETAEAEVLLRAASSGTIIARQLSKSSGYKDWDDAVLRAIDKTGSLPRDTDGRVQTSMTLIFRRKE